MMPPDRAAGSTPLTNWGRWGADDEQGAANFVTPELIVSASRLVKQGRVISLAHEIRSDGVPLAPLRSPAVHLMSIDGGDFAAGLRLGGGFFGVADDYLFMACQGGTHVDALSHLWYGEQLYNGNSSNRVRSYGATRLGIENLPFLVTRGVYLDVAAAKGVTHLDGGEVITGADLEGCAAAEGLQVGRGDAVLIRTGWTTMFASDPERYYASSPGIGLDAAEWLAARQVCAVGADNMAVEVIIGPELYEDGAPGPLVHKLLIRDCGTYLLELLDLEELAAAGASEFLFAVAPLKIRGAVGSPINPLAII
jgi:kynurenine formamidase